MLAKAEELIHAENRGSGDSKKFLGNSGADDQECGTGKRHLHYGKVDKREGKGVRWPQSCLLPGPPDHMMHQGVAPLGQYLVYQSLATRAGLVCITVGI